MKIATQPKAPIAARYAFSIQPREIRKTGRLFREADSGHRQ